MVPVPLTDKPTLKRILIYLYEWLAVLERDGKRFRAEHEAEAQKCTKLRADLVEGFIIWIEQNVGNAEATV